MRSSTGPRAAIAAPVAVTVFGSASTAPGRARAGAARGAGTTTAPGGGEPAVCVASNSTQAAATALAIAASTAEACSPVPSIPSPGPVRRSRSPVTCARMTVAISLPAPQAVTPAWSSRRFRTAARTGPPGSSGGVSRGSSSCRVSDWVTFAPMVDAAVVVARLTANKCAYGEHSGPA